MKNALKLMIASLACSAFAHAQDLDSGAGASAAPVNLPPAESGPSATASKPTEVMPAASEPTPTPTPKKAAREEKHHPRPFAQASHSPRKHHKTHVGGAHKKKHGKKKGKKKKH